MTHTEALEKAAKLLRLSTSSNPHEAALAASRAQEIMDRFKFTATDAEGAGGEIKTEEPIRNFGDDPLDQKTDRWRGQLAMAIAKANQCKVYGGSILGLIGRASDVMTVRYLYSWLTREIEKIAARDCRGNGRTYWNNYRLGAVETISRKLAEAAAVTVAEVKAEALEAGGTMALSLVETSIATVARRAVEVEAWTKSNMRLRAGSAGRTRYNPNARAAGREAANAINLGGARAALGSSRPSLEGSR